MKRRCCNGWKLKCSKVDALKCQSLKVVNCEHCLHPTFIKFLIEKIKRGQPINVIGAHGVGRRRTLDDLQQCLTGHYLLLRIDCQRDVEGYASFIRVLARQLNMQAESGMGLNDCLAHMLASSQPILFILHNFDVLRGKPQFDAPFFDQLNRIAYQAKVCLLCVTLLPYCASRISFQACFIPVQ